MNFLGFGRSAPAFNRSDAPSAAQRAFRKQGACQISGFLSEETARRLRSFADDAYARIPQEIETNPTEIDPSLVSNFTVWHGIWMAGLLPLLRDRDQTLHDDFLSLTREVEQSFLHVMGDDSWAFCPERSFFRRHQDDKFYVPWHIDADAARTVTAGKRCINVWLPLNAVGASVPSLEFVLGSHAYMKRLPLIPLDQPNGHRSDEFAATVPGHRWIPEINLGDAVIFDQYTLHRTQTAPLNGAQRTSCEFRFASS